ncbi:MAG: ABC transporter ATP-binding protein [Kiloniellaceae bacterium]
MNERAGQVESSATKDGFVNFINVQKTYDGETLVIKDLNLTIRRGEFLTLLGPSGSGKTTTLLMLAGFEHPTSGEIQIEGRSLAREPAHRRDLGMVFQDYALFPHMTVAENVAFPLAIRKRAKQEIVSKTQAVLDMVKLGGYGDRQPSQLSGGQQQRVALARALVFQPRLVLMDEPLGALDKQLREQMQLEIKHIQNDLGITVVYVTHDQSEALILSDRIAVFNDGSIYQLGTPDELYEHPQNAFVAQFVGENNRLYGKVVGIDERFCEVALEAGGVVKAVPVKVDNIGSRTLISVRPERVVLNPDGGHCQNIFHARIEELIYLGDHTRVRVSLSETASDFVVKVPLHEGRHGFRVGKEIEIGWPAEHCRALDAP